MEIVDFSKKTFNEIPKQDNPAFMTKKEWDNVGENGCLLITKQDEQKPPYRNCGRLCVFKIEPVENPHEEESVTCLGLFWEFELAKMFADAFSSVVGRCEQCNHVFQEVYRGGEFWGKQCDCGEWEDLT